MINNIKRMLNALAYANAGDYLTRQQKNDVISNTPTPAEQPVFAASVASTSTRPQIGLYLGIDLADDLMQYVIHTCSQLRRGLTVLTPQSEANSQEILAPYQPMLDAAGIEVRVVTLTDEPISALAHALRHRPEIAFLVCNESGYFGHGLLNGTQRNGGMPVPVVLVAANDAAVNRPGEIQTKARRTA